MNVFDLIGTVIFISMWRKKDFKINNKHIETHVYKQFCIQVLLERTKTKKSLNISLLLNVLFGNGIIINYDTIVSTLVIF